MSPWWWLLFGALVALLLALDLFVFHRHARQERAHRALLWSAGWVALGLAFALVVALKSGHEGALAYVTAYLVELSLSVDNLFVFLALFTYFGVAREHQHRVLFWGILGAIVSRGAFIFAGVALVVRFHWMMYVLGVILIATAARLGLGEAEAVHPERNLAVRWASRILPMEKRFHGERFGVRTAAGWRFTPLLLVLVAIESTDVMFATDSVPAVLAVSRDAFVVYTSNVFAVMGLRSLYFALAGALRALRLLKPALAIILGLIGVKMLLAEVVEVPTAVTLASVGAILAVATVASLLLPGKRVRSER
ncbi:MAG: TerC/Alx family metal homeostasis membrane protein [Thermoanaerobaculales bacterium]